MTDDDWRGVANFACAYPGLSLEEILSLTMWQREIFVEEYKRFNKG